MLASLFSGTFNFPFMTYDNVSSAYTCGINVFPTPVGPSKTKNIKLFDIV